MSELSTMLAGIEQRPGMWIGPPGRSLSHLRAYLGGYNSGRPLGDESGQLFDYFTRWVATYYRVSDGPCDGFRLILNHLNGDDRLAFDEFFRLWPLYQRDRAEYGPDGISARYRNAMELLISQARAT